jgi:hypothetical protein
MSILSQHQISDVPLIVLKKLNLRIKRSRKKLCLSDSASLAKLLGSTVHKITAAEN